MEFSWFFCFATSLIASPFRERSPVGPRVERGKGDMNERLLQFLRCPKCLDALHALVYERETAKGEISAGLLVSQCGAVYPIWKGVPRMLLPHRRALPDGFLRQFRDRLAADSTDFLHESEVQKPAM